MFGVHASKAGFVKSLVYLRNRGAGLGLLVFAVVQVCWVSWSLDSTVLICISEGSQHVGGLRLEKKC